MTRVFVNGTFDILHPGHIKLLKRAKDLGVVLVAIDSDERVQMFKGPNRPVNSYNVRKEILEAIKYVDYVVPFDSEIELRKIINSWRPHCMVKGSDYREKYIVGEDLVPEIVFVERTNDSTTKIIERISNR